MKKIILSVAVAAMALSTTASALEDIKVSGQAKLYYETNNGGDADLFSSKSNSSGEVVFKLGLTGKQGVVGFGAEVTQGSSMGLEGNIVGAVRTSANNLDNQDGTGDMYVSKAYFTAPVAPDTIIKMGRQELNTPFAFTEKWNAQQNNFDALVAINSSIENLTVIGAFVGQTNTAGGGSVNHKATQEFNQMWGGAYAVGALYKNDMFAVNGWAYDVKDVAGSSTLAFWADAGMNIAGANIKGIVAMMAPNADGMDSTTGFAGSVGYTVSGIKLFGAASYVGEGSLPLGNVATNFKKTKIPTAGVYTDGKYVAMPETMAFKLKASGKIGTTGVLLQGVMCDGTADNDANENLDAQEIDLIISQKVGAFNLKGILMHRSWSEDNHDAQQHIRVIASVNF